MPLLCGRQLVTEEGVNDSLSCMATAPSGEMMGFGTLEGAVLQVPHLTHDAKTDAIKE